MLHRCIQSDVHNIIHKYTQPKHFHVHQPIKGHKKSYNQINVVPTSHIVLSHTPKNPVKVGGSRPCLILQIVVSGSLPAGSDAIYS